MYKETKTITTDYVTIVKENIDGKKSHSEKWVLNPNIRIDNILSQWILSFSYPEVDGTRTIFDYHSIFLNWDEDEDKRVFEVVNKLYDFKLLHICASIGERKGSLEIVLNNILHDNPLISNFNKNAEILIGFALGCGLNGISDFQTFSGDVWNVDIHDVSHLNGDIEKLKSLPF